MWCRANPLIIDGKIARHKWTWMPSKRGKWFRKRNPYIGPGICRASGLKMLDTPAGSRFRDFVLRIMA